jgi:hypothetical protein
MDLENQILDNTLKSLKEVYLLKCLHGPMSSAFSGWTEPQAERLLDARMKCLGEFSSNGCDSFQDQFGVDEATAYLAYAKGDTDAAVGALLLCAADCLMAIRRIKVEKGASNDEENLELDPGDPGNQEEGPVVGQGNPVQQLEREQRPAEDDEHSVSADERLEVPGTDGLHEEPEG